MESSVPDCFRRTHERSIVSEIIAMQRALRREAETFVAKNLRTFHSPRAWLFTMTTLHLRNLRNLRLRFCGHLGETLNSIDVTLV